MALVPVQEKLASERQPSAQEIDEFYYGHRLQVVYDAAGNEDYVYIPLTQDDFLDPQEGDYFVEGTLHERDVEKVKDMFRHLHRGHPNFTVYSDLKIVWGIEGLSNPAPDVSVIPHVLEPAKPRGRFEVMDEGTRPVFVLEMVSPRYREPDLERKVAIYERAGVQEYFIVDCGLRDWDDDIAYTVFGYRMVRGRYAEIRPDARGWLFSDVNQAWIGVNPERDGFLLVDARTGQRVLPDLERAEIAEERAEIAEERAKAVEQVAYLEAEARAAAERRIRELEAELSRLAADK